MDVTLNLSNNAVIAIVVLLIIVVFVKAMLP